MYSLTGLFLKTTAEDLKLDSYECSVPNSSSGLLFVKSGRNPGGFLVKIRAKIWAKLDFVILSSFYDLGHVQTDILPFGEQLHNALNVH